MPVDTVNLIAVNLKPTDDEAPRRSNGLATVDNMLSNGVTLKTRQLAWMAA